MPVLVIYSLSIPHSPFRNPNSLPPSIASATVAETRSFCNIKAEKKIVTVHGVHSSSSDRRDIPVPHHGTAGLENPAYRAFMVPVNGYRKSKKYEDKKV
jgi:hypothetical protein